MPSQYATLDTRKQLVRQINDMDACKANPVTWEKIQNKHRFVKQRTDLQAQLNLITPPDTTGRQKDALKKRTAMLVTALQKGNEAVPSMPTDRQMWDSRAGSVGQHMTWESFWKRHTLDEKGNPVSINPHQGQRGAVWELKDRLRTLRKEAEADDPDVANLETIRPNAVTIPLAESSRQSYGLSFAAKQKYDDVFPDHTPTEVENKLGGSIKRRSISDEERCTATTISGTRCKQPAVPGSKHCLIKTHTEQIANSIKIEELQAQQ